MPATRSSIQRSSRQDDSVFLRVLEVANRRLFAFGYSGFTMDELAHELGMSKKTLYVYFSSKDALVGAIIDRMTCAVRDRLEAFLADEALTFAEKFRSVIDTAAERLAKATPVLLRDLQRFAPHLFQKFDDIRRKNIPLVFGRLIRLGIAEGAVRPEIDPDFAAEFWLQAVRGLVDPANLDRLQLPPRDVLHQAAVLFLGGLVTPAGRKDYEKHFPR